MDGSGTRSSACQASWRGISFWRMFYNDYERTEIIGGALVRSRRHWRAVRCLESSALIIVWRSMSVGRPPFGDVTVTSSAMADHYALVRSVASCIG